MIFAGGWGEHLWLQHPRPALAAPEVASPAMGFARLCTLGCDPSALCSEHRQQLGLCCHVARQCQAPAPLHPTPSSFLPSQGLPSVPANTVVQVGAGGLFGSTRETGCGATPRAPVLLPFGFCVVAEVGMGNTVPYSAQGLPKVPAAGCFSPHAVQGSVPFMTEGLNEPTRGQL